MRPPAGDRVGDLIGQAVDHVPADARLPLLVLLATLAGWVLLFGLAMLATRPLPVRASPATQDLPGDEPPAVVSVLANTWSITEDAAESTLLDLAARGYLELRQPDNEPRHTTVHVTAEDPRAAAAAAARQARVLRSTGGEEPLTVYERQVLDHVKGIAVGGVVPLTALTFRDPGRAGAWASSFASAVLADARRRGLIEPRVPRWVVTLLGVAAVAPALAAGWFTWIADGRTDARALGVGIVPFGVLTAVAGRNRGLRGTTAGRARASAWLGVRGWLEVDTSFAALPPSAVAVWDRYLAYGDALGVTHVSSAVIDLGMGNRRRVWSSFGGHWRQVRVHYRGNRARYGATTVRLVLGGLARIAIGVVLLRAQGLDAWTGRFERVGTVLLLGSLAILLSGGYRLVRTVTDTLTTRTLVAEVLWIAPWKSTTNDDSTVVTLYYLAVDDGTADRTTAWALPPEIPQTFRTGQTVEVTVRPWSRRVITVVPVPVPVPVPAAPPTPAAPPVPVPVPAAVPAVPPVVAPAVLAVVAAAAGGAEVELLSAAELSGWFGVPLQPGQSLPVGPTTSAWSYRRGTEADPGADVVLVSAGRGTADGMALERARRGTAVPGLGEEAYLVEQGAVARWGNVVVQVSVPPRLAIGRESLLTALQAAVLRVAKQRGR